MVRKIMSILLLLIVGVTFLSGCSSTTGNDTQIENPQGETNQNNVAEDNSEENSNAQSIGQPPALPED